MTAAAYTFVDTRQGAAQAAAALEADGLLAIDTEFHSERRYYPKLYLVQARLPGGQIYVFDATADGVLSTVAEVLLSHDWLVHGGHSDMVLLERHLGSLPDAVFDTQIGAGLCGQRFPERYGVLVEHFTGIFVDKSQTLSDWSRRPLSDEQLSYAAGDVEVLHATWDGIHAALADLDRTDLARAACDEARSVVVAPPSVDADWRRVAGRSSMTAHQLAVLQELVAWREELARELNSPSRSIASDGVLKWLARAQPLSTSSMAARKVPRAVVKKHGEDLIERISRAARRPEWAWPKPVAPQSLVSARLAWLTGWAACTGLAESWAPDLVLPERLITELVVGDVPSDDQTKDLLGWRHGLIGDALRAVFDDRAPLAWPR